MRYEKLYVTHLRFRLITCTKDATIAIDLLTSLKNCNGRIAGLIYPVQAVLRPTDLTLRLSHRNVSWWTSSKLPSYSLTTLLVSTIHYLMQAFRVTLQARA